MNLVDIFKALANTKRLEIIALLGDPKKYFWKNTCNIINGGVCLKAIESKVNLSQSTVSHYINILYKANLITLERIGQWSYCRINYETFSRLNNEINNIINLSS